MLGLPPLTKTCRCRLLTVMQKILNKLLNGCISFKSNQQVDNVQLPVGNGKTASEEGITFEMPPGRSIPDELKKALRHAHVNLGHPSVEDMKRLVRVS